MADFGKGLVLGAVSAASVYAAISALTSKRYVTMLSVSKNQIKKTLKIIIINNALCLKKQNTLLKIVIISSKSKSKSIKRDCDNITFEDIGKFPRRAGVGTSL